MRVVLVVQKYNIILIDTIHELEKGKNCVFVVGNVIFPDHLNCCKRKVFIFFGCAPKGRDMVAAGKAVRPPPVGDECPYPRGRRDYTAPAPRFGRGRDRSGTSEAKYSV